MSAGVVIAGGGLAAQRCAETLRRSGYEAAVRIVSGEAIAPYDRPPLSKAFLSGDAEAPEIALRPSGWHAEHDVELLLGEAAAGLDPDARRLLLESGSTLPYEHLVIATGSRPRMPAAAVPYDNVHSLRTLGDAARLRDELRPGRRLVVLGAGLIGQEVAATASAAGVDVTLVEAEDLPLARVLHPDISRWLVGLQREAGVEVQLGVPVTAFEGAGRTLRALRVADGRRVELDLLLVAIGVTPCTEWLPAAIGQLVRRPDISAAGDAAGGNHWEAAAAQGRATALEILGRPRPELEKITSWWSDIHGVRLQGLGDITRAETLDFDGDPAGRSFTVVGFRGGAPVGALAADRARDVPQLRQLLSPPPMKEAA